MTSDLSPFSAALIEEMALQPKGTVLRRRAIPSDCSCSEIQLHQFIINTELFGPNNCWTGFYLLAKKKIIHFLQLTSFICGQLSTCVYLCHLEKKKINTGGNRGQSVTSSATSFQRDHNLPVSS